MRKILLSGLIVAAVLAPIALAANSDTPTYPTKLNMQKTTQEENITCSGRCESCSKSDCPRRRRPYKQ